MGSARHAPCDAWAFDPNAGDAYACYANTRVLRTCHAQAGALLAAPHGKPVCDRLARAAADGAKPTIGTPHDN